jgi:sulfite reductase alpha subunit-like flavoprotein
MILGLFRNNQDASNTLAKYAATSRCLLYFGSASKESLLYKHELDEIQRLYPNQFQYHCALSREPGLPKTYVQDLLKRDVSPIIDRLRRGAHIYFSGYKDMITGIKQVLKEALCNSSASDDSEYINFINVLKAENRWHSETYV